MYDDQSEKYKKLYGTLKPVDIEKYMLIIGAKEVEEIKRLSGLLQDKTWCHVNSTFEGGGVAEMLKSVVPIVRGLGINCKWSTSSSAWIACLNAFKSSLLICGLR